MIRWGIIGAGAVCEVKSAPAYQQVAGFELAAIMRRDETKAYDFARRHQISKVYTNAAELINDPEIDAVYIATPPDSHQQYGVQVAQAQKICCIEKPLAPTYEAAQAIVAEFERVNKPLFVAYYRRSLPRFQTVKAWLDDNLLGEIRHVQWHLYKPPNDVDKSGQYNWRTDPKIARGGYFDDLASHGLDLLTYLLGPVRTAQGYCVNQQGLYGAADAVTASWVHDSGITGAGAWNFGANAREDQVIIIGSEGRVSFSVFNEEPVVLESRSKSESRDIPNPQHIQQYHVQNMHKSLTQTSDHPSPGRSAAHTAWFMEQILGNV